MSNYMKFSTKFYYVVGSLLKNNNKLMTSVRPFSFFFSYSLQSRLYSGFQSLPFLVTSYDRHCLILKRENSKSRSKGHADYSDDESSDEEQDEDDYLAQKDGDIKTQLVTSLRADLVLKALIGISRRKIEEQFYQNKIRVNGMVLLKKAYNVVEGDEIDIIKGTQGHNSSTLNVARVKVLKVKLDPDSNKILLKAWRFKSLIIKNYEGVHKWQEPEQELN